jgi:hypothetical protein
MYFQLVINSPGKYLLIGVGPDNPLNGYKRDKSVLLFGSEKIDYLDVEIASQMHLLTLI